MKEGWKVHMMMSYLLLMTFLNNEIQAIPGLDPKCVNHKGDYVEK